MSYREQHDAEFTSYICRDDSQPAAPWQVVYKGVAIGFYRTREEARVKIRSLKPFRSYRVLTPEERELCDLTRTLLEIDRQPWDRFKRILQDVHDIEPLVYDPT